MAAEELIDAGDLVRGGRLVPGRSLLGPSGPGVFATRHNTLRPGAVSAVRGSATTASGGLSARSFCVVGASQAA
jgi:hypothetical protein